LENKPFNDIGDLVRYKLNSLPEKDQQGNYYRLGWQIISLITANAAENSTNSQLQILGKFVKIGTKNSISDYVAEKINNWLDQFLEDTYDRRSTSL